MLKLIGGEGWGDGTSKTGDIHGTIHVSYKRA
jgi:hypothetical protein